MSSAGSTLPWKERFQAENEITTLENYNTEDLAALTVGKLIRQWFIDNPGAVELILRRDGCGVPVVNTPNHKNLRKSFNKKWGL